MKAVCIAILACGVPAAGLLLAQDTPERPRVGITGSERRLTLEDAIQQALDSNLQIEIERTNVDTAAQILRAAQGVFDPVFRYRPSLETRNTPTPNVLISPTGTLTERIHREDFSLQQLTPWRGLSLSANFDNARQSTNNPFIGLNPFLETRLTFGIALPLVRGREIDASRAQIKVRAKQREVSDTELALRVIDVVTQVQSAYWNLVAARREREVRADGVALGREQLARSQRQIESGTLAPVELAAAEAELQRRIDSYMASVNAVTQAENGLKLLLAGSREDALWSEGLAPVDARPLEPSMKDLGEAVRTGLSKRPELQAVRLLTEANDVQAALARDRRKPQVNLVAGYSTAGLSGTVNAAPNPFEGLNAPLNNRVDQLSVLAGLAPLPVAAFPGPPERFLGGYGRALSNLGGGSYYTVQGGIQLEWNMRNRTADAEIAQAAVADRRLKLQMRQAEQGVEAEVRNALQALESASARIEAAQASERAAQEKLESEIRLFQTGESTNFLVLTRQNELLDSRLRAVIAVLEHNRAVARLEQATGLTMEAHRIALN
jgi:outer membrane protein TolC